MPLVSPNLDDRDFDQLVQEAKDYIKSHCSTWTDFSPGDPGIVLLEAFATLTETMIYRLNRVPEKAYVEFLRLIGVSLVPPSSAAVGLTFSVSRPAATAIDIPRGTRVTVSRAGAGSDPIIFATTKPAAIPAGATEVTSVLAHHCDLVQGELAGRGTGQPGLTIRASRPPLIAPTGEELDLVVGVEALPVELELGAPTIEFNGKAYRIWRSVDHFADTGGETKVYVVDRLAGEIRFANAAQARKPDGSLADPRALGEAPAAGREIRLWYRRGGGASGNVAAGTITVLKDPIPSVQVTNPTPATGGRSAETLANARVRGPLELRAPWRAVTAADFEFLALSRGVAARAKAFTQAALWKYALAGTVEVLLVPDVPETERPGGKVTLQQLRDRQTPVALEAVQSLLQERQPLGTSSVVRWADYKSVQVKARVVAGNEANAAAIRDSVLERLYAFISPLPSASQPTGWKFGEALRASNIYDAARLPGVSYIDRVQLLVDNVPDQDVTALLADPFQPNTWYAGAGRRVFRSVNNGDGWEVAQLFEGCTVRTICAHPTVPGLLALAAKLDGPNAASSIRCSRDCGNTWPDERTIPGDVNSMVWVSRDGVPVLLIASSVGLFELLLQPGATPVLITVFDGDKEDGFYAVAAVTDARASALHVAVAAAQTKRGIYLSDEGGKEGSFRLIGLENIDVRVLAIQREGVRSFLWAGVAASNPKDTGTGCFSWELLPSGDPPERWIAFGNSWSGGSCESIAFQGPMVLAGTHNVGVIRLPARRTGAQWEGPRLDSGLPTREVRQLFHPIEALAVDPQHKCVLAGGGKVGVYRSPAADAPPQFKTCSARLFDDRLTIPPTWLFCSGEHSITVVNEDEA